MGRGRGDKEERGRGRGKGREREARARFRYFSGAPEFLVTPVSAARRALQPLSGVSRR